MNMSMGAERRRSLGHNCVHIVGVDDGPLASVSNATVVMHADTCAESHDDADEEY